MPRLHDPIQMGSMLRRRRGKTILNNRTQGTDSREMSYLKVDPSMFYFMRHWLKRHGWLVAWYDGGIDLFTLVRIDPIHSGQSVEAAFIHLPNGGIKFLGYNVTFVFEQIA